MCVHIMFICSYALTLFIFYEVHYLEQKNYEINLTLITKINLNIPYDFPEVFKLCIVPVDTNIK